MSEFGSGKFGIIVQWKTGPQDTYWYLNTKARENAQLALSVNFGGQIKSLQNKER